MDDKTTRETGKEERLNVLITFLQRTKEGKYAQVGPPPLQGARIREEAEPVDLYEEAYYYSVS